MPLEITDRDKLAEALLKCDSMARPQARDAIERDLPPEVRNRLNGRGTNQEAVVEMVDVCAQFPEGLKQLLQRVHFYEGNSFSWQAVELVAAEIEARQQVQPIIFAPPPDVAIVIHSVEIAAVGGYDVFLSHNGKDKPAVERLARQLEDKAGLKPFLDKWHLVPGEPWQEALEQALDESRTYAVFLGASGLGPWENVEMRSALEERAGDRNRRVIPVLLPGADPKDPKLLPRFLRRLTWVDFRNGLEDVEAFNRLVAGVRGKRPGRIP